MKFDRLKDIGNERDLFVMIDRSMMIPPPLRQAVHKIRDAELDIDRYIVEFDFEGRIDYLDIFTNDGEQTRIDRHGHIEFRGSPAHCDQAESYDHRLGQ